MHASTDSLKVVYVAASAEQAHMLAGVLADEGIAASVSNESLQALLGSVPAGMPTAPRVLVGENDAARAREIVLECERRLRSTKAPAPVGRSWSQFSVKSLLFVTACVAVYFGVERAISLSGRGVHPGGGLAAVQLLVTIAFFVAVYCKLRQRRANHDD